MRSYNLILSLSLALLTACSGQSSTAPANTTEATAPATTPAWSKQLEQKIRAIDTSSPGNLGVYVKRFGTNEEMNYHTDRDWYFASTVKVPVAIAVLQLVEDGKISLAQRIAFQASDPVDGSGEVQFKRPGAKLKVSYLLEKMLTQSDSTATDMLIRLIGVETLNSQIRSKMGVSGFQRFTTILQVREDAFNLLHPNASKLTNRDFIDLKRYKTPDSRLKAVAKKMGVSVASLNEKSIEAAFEKYYKSNLNSGSLKDFGLLLERLTKGELLSEAHTKLVLRHMTAMKTGETRIKAGLPKGFKFAQKTGTQTARICNIGIITPKSKSEKVIVTACLEKFSNFKEAESTLKRVGQVLAPMLAAGQLAVNE